MIYYCPAVQYLPRKPAAYESTDACAQRRTAKTIRGGGGSEVLAGWRRVDAQTIRTVPAQLDGAVGLCVRAKQHGEVYPRRQNNGQEIPREIIRQFGELTDEAIEVIDRAVALRPDCSELLRAALYMHYWSGHTDIDWQMQMIERIHKIDPSNIKAESTAIFSHSIGWGAEEDFWKLVEFAIKNHPNDPRAMNMLAEQLGTELSRRLTGWQTMTGMRSQQLDL